VRKLSLPFHKLVFLYRLHQRVIEERALINYLMFRPEMSAVLMVALAQAVSFVLF
jgi:hypothetical protein